MRFVEIYRERCQLADLVLTNTSLVLSNGIDVHVSHFPYADPTLDGKADRLGEVVSDKFAPWRVIDDGSWLLCSHVHEPSRAARPRRAAVVGCLSFTGCQ